jgi:protein TonB
MRRDLIIGVLISLVVHGGFFGVGQLLKTGPKKAKAVEEEKVVQLAMPPIEPDEPEKVEQDEAPQQVQDFAPPMLTDVPQIVQPDSFVQKIEPPPPEGMKPVTGAITIPSGTRIGSGANLGEIFDLNKLDQPPNPRLQGKPVYPFEMRRAGITGEVTVAFIVDQNGDVQNAYAVKSTQREFEAAAIQAVSKWKFKPGKKGGKSVSTRMQVPIVFSITEE